MGRHVEGQQEQDGQPLRARSLWLHCEDEGAPAGPGHMRLRVAALLGRMEEGRCEGPRWAAVERSPEVGARKRRCKGGAYFIDGKLEGMGLDTGSGYLYYKPLQIARLDKDGKAWQPGEHRQTVDTDTWERLAAVARASM